MPESLDLVSTIGTWVGAGIGIIALIGIVGPALIWYASTRDKQKTLNEIGRENNGYLSRGFHMGPNIWLGRRVRAPLLRNADSLKTFGVLPSLDASKIKTLQTETSWVLYGLLLEAYSIPFKKGDGLLVREKKALLAVHPSWILVIGLLGRFSDRKNQLSFFTGKVPRYRFVKSRTPAPQPPPPTDVRAESGRSTRFEDRSLGPQYPVYPEETKSSPLDVSLLYGTTGTLSFSSTKPLPGEPALQTVLFGLNASCGCSRDELSPKDLFLLSLGFLKASQSQYISLGHLIGTPGEMGIDWGDADGEVAPPQPTTQAQQPFTGRGYNKFEPPSHAGYGPPDPYHYSYGSSQRARVQTQLAVYQLRTIALDNDVQRVGRALLGPDLVDTYTLMPVSSERAASVLQECAGRLRVPATSNWIRVARQYHDPPVGSYPTDGYGDIYIERSAAQKLAFALLNLRWHDERYLVDLNDNEGVGNSLFESALGVLPRFLFRLDAGLEWLGPSQTDKRKLSSVLKPLSELQDAPPGARMYKAAQSLDEVLGELGNHGDLAFIDQVIGILAITNVEFRDLVYESLKNLRETAASTIELEMPSATLKVPMAFGIMQHFYVDWQEMFPGQARSPETLNVSYTVVVLAAVRSLTKCAMLRSCPDSRPLLDAVLGMDDVVYMT
ncbi:hypothetical protein PG984_016679 [Apiospora sp. TS-2023a]